MINQVVYTTLPVGIIQWDASYIDDPTYHIGLYVASDATITLGSGADLYAGNYVLIWRMGDV